MLRSIEEYYAYTRTQKFARQNKFEFIFTLPVGLQNGVDDKFDVSSRLMMGVEQTELPGRLYASTETSIHGPTFKTPYQAVMDDLQITFRVSEDMLERRIFQQWHYLIQNPVTNNFAYKDQYTTNIEIRQYDSNGNFTYGVILFKAYPTFISPTTLDHTSEGTILRQNVGITYTKWLPLEIRTEEVDVRKDPTLSPIENIRDILDRVIPI